MHKLRSLLFISLLCLSPWVSASENSQDLLKKWVEMNSGSANQDGVLKIQSELATELKKLGFEVNLDPHYLLIATYTGLSAKTVTLIAHTDTVFEPSSPFQKWKLSEDGKQASGPGVIDDKGGVVVVLEGLKRFLAQGKPKFTIRVVSSPTEETGSLHALVTFRKLAKDSWLVLGFEPALDDGSIIESRRGNRWYHIKVSGKEAHAGRAHKDGINACNALANQLSAISKLTDYRKDVTVSIGHIEGGKDKFNIVCGNAEAKVDVRFSDSASRERVHKKILAILNQETVKGAVTTFELADDTPPFAKTPQAQRYLTKYLSIISRIEGKKVESKKSGGAADSNHFSREGAIIIDGLGAVGGKMHTPDEFLNLESLESRSEALKQFLAEL